MDRNALDWLFSTAPQTIAAFVGLIFAGVCFIIGKIDDRVEKDSTLLEIANEIKIQIYKGLNNLLWVTFIGITLDLLFLYLNPIENDRVLSLSLNGNFSPYFAVTILCLILNIYIIVKAILYIKEIMQPDFFDKTVSLLAKNYKCGSVNIGVFIEDYIKFEKVLRSLVDDNGYSQRPLTVFQMVRELVNRELIDKKDLEIILSINKLRNIVIHGGNIQKIEKHIDDELKRITQEIMDKSKKNNQ